MIRNRWYAILESKEVGKKPLGIERMGEKLLLWRESTGATSLLHCIYDICCHRGASLSLGCTKDEMIACPFHGFLYDGSGKVTQIPALGRGADVPERFRVHAYPVIEKYGFIWLWYGSYPKNFDPQSNNPLPEIPFFPELTEGFIYNTFSEVWNVHYTRAIENQLDVVHVPFVHSNTIGKGGKTVVHGPVVEWDGDCMTFYVENVQDNGTTPAKGASEMEYYKDLFSLQYLVPNLWQNRISSKVRVFAAFVPVDHEHTKIYVRFYQKFLPLPGIGHFVAWAGNIFNKVVLHQDRRVVLTQLPKKSELTMQERLIPGDMPIIEFRKRRATLLEEQQESKD